MRIRNSIVIGLLGFLAGISAVAAQEIVPITETTEGRIDFMSAAKDTPNTHAIRKSVKLTDQIYGILEFPDNPRMVNGKVAAMVVLHGSGGPNYTVAPKWARWLREQGVATFLVDSFTPRSIVNTIGSQEQISYTASGLDAVIALKVLAKHPRIDRNRIGVIGFSRGGVGAQTASFEVIRKAVIDDDLKFAVHLPFYGSCSRIGKTTGAPIVHFFGSADDFYTEEGCKQSTEAIRARGGNIELVVYLGARHGFDSDQVRPFLERNMVVSGKCNQMFDLDHQKFYFDGQEVTLSDYNAKYKACTSRGMWYQMDPAAKAASRERVKLEIERNLFR